MTPLQQWVAKTFSDILRVSRVDLADSFVDLGGHSLHAVRAVFVLRRTLGVDVPLRALFDSEDLRQLCASIEEQLAGAGTRPDFRALLGTAGAPS